MKKHTTIPDAAGLYWYFAKDEERARPVFVDHSRWKDCFKSFNGSQQSWLRDGEYLIGPQPAPTEEAVNGEEPLPFVTDPDEFRSLIEALVEAERGDDHERAKILRARVDASDFGECPTCNDKEDRVAGCDTCGGEGFVRAY
ncbi:hypothetical protein ACI77O_12725 [Pseudomonas tritici]|uniref:hypothetical protein n=1 Tax=Pseudomonas tritici TaxID=2745518 RepID=UPI00387B3FCB